MTLNDWISAIPKVELHVHLEGAIRPETLLQLAKKHDIALVANTVEGLRQWYQFTDFPHFVDVYVEISKCIRTTDDLELIARDFLRGQAEQNILYSEVTYTAYTHYHLNGLAFADQLNALNRARAWGIAELGVTMNYIVDIAREVTLEQGLETARWIAEYGREANIVAMGLGGYEVGNPPEKFTEAFALTREVGIPAVIHAGETEGAASIWGALNALHAVRIGHGVRCLEDAELVKTLRERQIPLEICPTSNVCLKVFPDWANHPLPRLLDEGLYVTINSDDPPLFNTSLTEEFQNSVATFGWQSETIRQMVNNAVDVSLLPDSEKATLRQRVQDGFAKLGN